jgi:molybdate transport system ATP-binding protein
MGRLLGADRLLSRNIQELSTGELRKVLVARALVGSPRVLVCDEICDGLDRVARTDLLNALDRVARNGTQLLYATHRREELLPVLTHQLVLDQGRVAQCRRLPRPIGSPNQGLLACGPNPLRVEPHRTAGAEGRRVLVRLERADVFLGRRRALRDIGLEICRGQHWAVLGPNGSGKSTLLKLIAGDLHPARGGRTQHFGLRQGAALWELKQKIGFVSPELQSQCREPMSGADAIASGFGSWIALRREITRSQRQKVQSVMDLFHLRALSDKNVLRMSYGELRQILLARAVVQDPALLLCDEPFDGLDAAARAQMTRALETVAERGTSLVVVTHHPAELPRCTTHVAELEEGRIVFQETTAAFAARMDLRF